MNRNAKRCSTIGTLSALVLVFLLVIAGCAGPMGPENQPKTAANATQAAAESVSEILTSAEEGAVRVIIRGNRLLTYSSFRQPEPLGFTLYLPEVRFKPDLPVALPKNDLVTQIQASNPPEADQPARIEVALQRDVPASVSRQGNDLILLFASETPFAETDLPVPAPEIAAIAPTEKTSPAPKPALLASPKLAKTSVARQLQSVSATRIDETIEVHLTADGTIRDYKTFTIAEPARIVVDLFNLKSPRKSQKTISVGTEMVRGVRYFGHPDRLRVVLDTTPAFLSQFRAETVADGLLIRVGKPASPAPEVAAASEPEPAAPSAMEEGTPETIQLSAAGAPVAGVSVPAPDQRSEQPAPVAWVNRIDFASEEKGKSALIVGTTRDVEYKISNQSDRVVLLELMGAKIPGYRQRPLITTHFDGAVDRVVPLYKETMKNARITIELREAVPYTVDKGDGLLTVRFDASTVPPKPVEEANLPPWKKSIAEADLTPEVGLEPEALPAAGPKEEDSLLDLSMTKKVYTGEKISLDFYETDIKNVFRILREVSGKNYAIDKDVTGKVTLALDKPVPWDQVLDLILKMNNLGMVDEGDIIRIATRATLRNEEAMRQSQLEAIKKTQAAKAELEPTQKEYIPVNYANARTDVLPHIVLTPGRGSVTVDDRNNQLIMTDVVEKILQARETVKRIDKVIPQVIIEARIIEATNTFSREVGTQWGADGGPVFTRELGNGLISEGVVNYDLSATNPPTSSLGQLGISFSKLTGTPFDIIDARLQASESEGQVKIISSPKVVTMNKKEAVITQGLKYPYNKLDADGNTTTEFQEVALKLTVTPLVTPDDRVSMKVKIENNEVGAIINNQVSFTTKEATTELLVNDTDTVVIGGIRKTRKELGESGLPGLKDVPMLGWLFKSSRDEETKEELIIFITPRIVRLEQK